MKTFEEVFNAMPTVTASAPGRVNLLGEHTDYNGGYVMPTAIPQQTCVSLRLNEMSCFRLYSSQLNKLVELNLKESPLEHFASYIYGCLRMVQGLGMQVPAFDIHICSNVPMGVGLSSSAALEVAMLQALRAMLDLKINDIEIAKLAQQAEIQYAKVDCGIMDQMAVSLADTKRMLFLDTRTLEYEKLALPENAELLVSDTGFASSLAKSK